MLLVSGLTKRYGKNTAIDHISFEAAKGEIVGLVGHNGCGKSTTMNIITGYIAATSGRVEVDGLDHVRHAQAVRGKIGYLPEVPSLYPDMTVEEQLRFSCDLRGIKNREAAIAAACERADVRGVRKRLIRNLSKGYRQRIALAQALLGEPPLLILDEPTSGLDPRQMAEMRAFIKRAAQTHTVLMSSHVLSEVEAVCDRVIVLSNGCLVADAVPAQLRRDFAEKDRYQLTASCDAQRLQELLAHRCSDIRTLACNGAGYVRVRFTCSEPEAVLRPLLDQPGLHIVDFGPVQPELEEIVLSLTRDCRYGS